MMPKVCSANPYTNQYFVLRGALKYFKWSAHRISLGTTGVVPDTQMPPHCNPDTQKTQIIYLFMFCIVFVGLIEFLTEMLSCSTISKSMQLGRCLQTMNAETF